MSVLERVRETADEANGADGGDRAWAREVRGRLKADLIERVGLSTVAGMLDADEGRARPEIAVAVQAILNGSGYEDVPAALHEKIMSQVVDEVCGLGPIQPLLDDPTITEVMINGCEALLYERDGQICSCEAAFDSDEQILIAMDRILAPLGRRLDRSSPLVDARLPNGDRVNAVASPASVHGPSVTIRKFSKQVRSLQQLVELGSLPAWYAQLLSWAVRAKAAIAVAGGTGSGKTTLLNALSCEIDHGERIVTIEDSAELRFESHPDVVSLEAQEASIEGRGEVTIRDLVRNALRMRPDRIVVGEVRGEEAIDMLQAMTTGHEGSLTTLHAGDAQEAILRLVLMARFGMDLPAQIIEEQIASALDLVVIARRLVGSGRVISTLTEVNRDENGGVALDECVSYNLVEGSWHLVREPGFVSRAVENGLLSEEEVKRWRRSCS